MTQQALAAKLGVSQGYVSLLEAGARPVPRRLQEKLVRVLQMGASALPVQGEPKPLTGDGVQSALSALGYPGFAHVRGRRMNPAEVVLRALLSDELDARLVEGLVWVLRRYPDLDWPWLVSQAKQHDLQNRLGFLVDCANAARPRRSEDTGLLAKWADVLARSRLDRDDALATTGLLDSERRWLLANRSPMAKQWRVLTTLDPERVVNVAG
jgi:transcriptional regulator with XRE-family HTH domain